MRIEVWHGMARDKKLMEFVEFQPVDAVTEKLMAAREDCYAVPGGGVTNENAIKKWAIDGGYKLRTKLTEHDNAAFSDA